MKVVLAKVSQFTLKLEFCLRTFVFAFLALIKYLKKEAIERKRNQNHTPLTDNICRT
jgi:hypothetical protein